MTVINVHEQVHSWASVCHHQLSSLADEKLDLPAIAIGQIPSPSEKQPVCT